MTKREPCDAAEDERLFDTVLAEHWRGEAAAEAVSRLLAAPAAERTAAWGRAAAAATAAAAPPWRRHALAIAAALVAVSVVTTMMVWRPAPASTSAQPSQEPSPGRQTHPRDLAHFLTLLPQVTAIHLGGMEAIGAVMVATANGVTDALESTCWPETVRIDGEALAAWRRECEASARGVTAAGNSAAQFALHFVLADGSTIEAMWGGGRPVVGGDWQLAPNEALQRLLETAGQQATRLHRLARGQVLTVGELAELPATTRRIESPWFGDGMAERLSRFPGLEAFVLARSETGLGREAMAQLAARTSITALDLRAVDIDPADLAPLAQLRGLTSLSLAGIACSGAAVATLAPNLSELTFERGRPETGDLKSLRACKRLRTLRLIDCEWHDPASFPELASLPSLADLTLRSPELPRSLVEALQVSKLRTLRIVDAPLHGADFAPLAALPTLRELAVLAPTLDDGAVPDLGELRQLTTLRLMNVKLSADGLAELQKALPKCAIDCVPGRRVFDSATWIR